MDDHVCMRSVPNVEGGRQGTAGEGCDVVVRRTTQKLDVSLSWHPPRKTVARQEALARLPIPLPFRHAFHVVAALRPGLVVKGPLARRTVLACSVAMAAAEFGHEQQRHSGDWSNN